MDSLLSTAQRCSRSADSLVRYGLFSQALIQLDKSIGYLNELKVAATSHDNIQLINEQIEAVDRKMRSVAIKQTESIKKRQRIETLISKAKSNSRKSVPLASNTVALNTSIMLLDDDDDHRSYLDANQAVLVHHQHRSANNSSPLSYMKLVKSSDSVIEELTTTNSEYRKVNTFLVDEIEQLKNENDYLKVELLKIHAVMSSNNSASSNGSITSSMMHTSSSTDSGCANGGILGRSSSHDNDHTSTEKFSKDKINDGEPVADFVRHDRSKSKAYGQKSTSKIDYSSHYQPSGSRPVEETAKTIDLSKYIDENEDDEYDVDHRHSHRYNDYTNSEEDGNYSDDSGSNNAPPFEFTIDS